MICMPSFIKGAVVGAFVSVIVTVAITLTVVEARQPEQVKLHPALQYHGDDYEAEAERQKQRQEKARRLAEEMRKDSDLPRSKPLAIPGFND